MKRSPLLRNTPLKKGAFKKKDGKRTKRNRAADEKDRKALRGLPCARCERTGQELHHIDSRSKEDLRHKEFNHVKLCCRCHDEFHHSPNLAKAWVLENLPDSAARLNLLVRLELAIKRTQPIPQFSSEGEAVAL